MRARQVGRCSRLTKNRRNGLMDHAGAFVDGIQIAAMVVAIGALIYAICRIEHWRKTFESLLSECKRLASETPDSAAP